MKTSRLSPLYLFGYLLFGVWVIATVHLVQRLCEIDSNLNKEIITHVIGKEAKAMFPVTAGSGEYVCYTYKISFKEGNMIIEVKDDGMPNLHVYPDHWLVDEKLTRPKTPQCESSLFEALVKRGMVKKK